LVFFELNQPIGGIDSEGDQPTASVPGNLQVISSFSGQERTPHDGPPAAGWQSSSPAGASASMFAGRFIWNSASQDCRVDNLPALK
jgi:hypothetical protein